MLLTSNNVNLQLLSAAQMIQNLASVQSALHLASDWDALQRRGPTCSRTLSDRWPWPERQRNAKKFRRTEAQLPATPNEENSRQGRGGFPYNTVELHVIDVFS
jgi:hypothetical protein